MSIEWFYLSGSWHWSVLWRVDARYRVKFKSKKGMGMKNSTNDKLLGTISVDLKGLKPGPIRHQPLSELTPPKELKEMANVINRLRELSKEETSAAEKAGIECGRAWAKETATPKELRRLDEFRSDRNYEQSMLMIDGHEGAASLNVLSAIQGSEADWRDAEEFFSSESQPMLSEEGFATGFVDGALEVWHQVKDAL